jgi:hypothetical protein
MLYSEYRTGMKIWSRLNHRIVIPATLVFVAFLGFSTVAYANHSWGGYHWARTSNPFTLKIGDNVTSAWDGYLATTASDWSQSSVLDATIVAGSVKSVKRCNPVSGQVEVCNASYGRNGWLGVAQIWINGSHIIQGTTKVNDTYFNTSTYNTSAWRNMVMCQEVGHTLGLDHQDENFSNPALGTCMDYTSDPTPNQHPNQHDYDMLEQIYAHLDSTTTVGLTAPQRSASPDVDEQRGWGREIHRSADGRVSEFVRDLGLGHRVVTHVIWAE